MRTIALNEIDTNRRDLVGGKAAGLAELIRAGELVPPGFCLTARTRGGELPEAELLAAYTALGGGPVAVRSSATAEDLPDASFAGQQDTILNVGTPGALLDAVRACWASLDNERAVAYREANGIPHDTAHMAVVVQRMVQPRVAGVLFTANPVTGNRDQMTVDAAVGLGTAVVDGSVVPDHYVLNGSGEPSGGCLDPARLDVLRAAGERVQRHFGTPQDIEWAIDDDGTLWLLQSRPITTLFPLPPDTGRPLPRVFVHIGPTQGLHGPVTPMGMSVMRIAMAETIRGFGGEADFESATAGFVPIAGRMYGDFTKAVRSKRFREKLPAQLTPAFGHRVAAGVERVMADERFSPRPGLPFRASTMLKAGLRYTGPTIVGVASALLRPKAARDRAWRASERMMRAVRAPIDARTAEDRLDIVHRNWDILLGRTMFRLAYPLGAGQLAVQAATGLLKGVATQDEIDAVLRGMPHNVTTDMDLELWRLASGAAGHRELLLNTPPSELATRYLRDDLPDIGLAKFLHRYGFRAAAEIDLGVPRWSEDPAPVFATIANYLRITDPEQTPERRFAKAAAEAEAMLAELARRVRHKRRVRGRLGVAMLHRARELGGLRELLKFSWIPLLGQLRHHILAAGTELTDRGLLDRPEDVMFLEHAEALEAVAGAEHRDLVAARRVEHTREIRRRKVPDVLLSDGTDAETLIPRIESQDGSLVGMAGAPGTVTGPARVILDPSGAHLEPGEILVAPSTDPGWTPLFLTTAGLVTETGGPNAHGPTVAREYGIPAAIGVPDATQLIHTGQIITVNGSAGTVRIETAADVTQLPI